MLQSLYIENYAIIDKLTLEFGEGLNVLTGETGAGKSIIVGALKVLLGGKPPKTSIRSGENRAKVEAIFCVSDELRTEIQKDGIETKEEILIQREISGSGRGKYAINGRPVTQDMLKNISERLISISSQHDYQRLLKPSFHSVLLDNFADDSKTRNEYQNAWNEWQKCLNELKNFENDVRRVEAERGYLEHECKELEKLNLDDLDLESIEDERKKLKGAVKFKEAISLAVSSVYEDGGVVEQLACAEKNLLSVDIADAQRWLDTISRANLELSEVGQEMSAFLETLVEDPEKLNELEDLVYSIKEIERRFGSIELAVNRRDELQKMLSTIENSSMQIEELREKENIAKLQLDEVATRLTKIRKKSAIKLGREIENNLKKLAFAHPKFIVDLKALKEKNFSGAEEVEFLFAPNPGESPKPLIRIASGGELSRLHLALSRVAGEDNDGIVVYDEVDAGIGGETAGAVGKLLQETAESAQVVCITHLPQVASFGNNHLSVNKEVKDGRTFTSAKLVKGKERLEEIARLLGGVSETSLDHAKELLKNVLAVSPDK